MSFFVVLRSAREYRTPPPNVRPVGGPWHVVISPRPQEIDTISYAIYYKRGGHYQLIETQVSELRFVPPDCLTFRGLRVVGRPLFGMCGYRAPIETYDTLMTESELLRSARSRPSFRVDWRTREPPH